MTEHPDDHPGLGEAARTAEELAVVLRRLRRREARRREGAELTYRQLAAKAGWSHALVASYFTGKILPPTDRFDTLVRLLGASPAEQGALATARDRIEDARRQAQRATAGTGSSPPRQLPADVIGFVGRGDHLAELDHLLDLGRRASAVVISAVSGTAGVGKTALAVHWGHRVRSRFPDGVLFADLHGYGPGPPVDPERVLDRFLIDLGFAPAQVPPEAEAKAALYRSMLDGRRVLVVLDNAVSPQQVRPLLPGSSGCLVLVTSRNMLGGLVARERARRILLDVLPPADAVELLVGFAGPARVEAEPAAAVELARLCAQLPVALCVAGERTAARPEVPLSAIAAELAAGSRLDLLDADGDQDTAVRAVFAWSYRALAPDAARMFRLLGLHPGRDWDDHAAAALAGTDVGRAGALLETLAASNLIEQRGPDRHGLHDLLRAYAAERATADADVGGHPAGHPAGDPGGDIGDDGRAAVSRLLDYYRGTAAAAMDLLFPSEAHRRPRVAAASTPAPVWSGPPDAKAWLDSERPNLMASVAYGAANGWLRHACELAATLYRYLYTGAHYSDALEIHGHALGAARGLGDRRLEGTAMVNLAQIRLVLGEPDRSRDLYEEAVTVFAAIGDRAGEALARQRLGVLNRVQGRYAEAVACLGDAVAIFREIGDPLGEANTLGALGETHAERGEYPQARDRLERALAIGRELGDRVGQGNGLGSLGEVYRRWGRLREAQEHFESALDVFRTLGDHRAEARVLSGLGETLLAAGRGEDAMAHYRSALAVAREVGDPFEQGSASTGSPGCCSPAGTGTAPASTGRRRWPPMPISTCPSPTRSWPAWPSCDPDRPGITVQPDRLPRCLGGGGSRWPMLR